MFYSHVFWHVSIYADSARMMDIVSYRSLDRKKVLKTGQREKKTKTKKNKNILELKVDKLNADISGA